MAHVRLGCHRFPRSIVVLTLKLRGSSGFAGTALSQVMSMNLMLETVILTWTEVETSIGSVSRVKAFSEGIASEHLAGEINEPPEDWSQHGKIDFQGACGILRVGFLAFS